MKWSRHSADSYRCDGYLISGYRLGDQVFYTAWAPKQQHLLSYWGESADRAKAACAEHREKVA